MRIFLLKVLSTLERYVCIHDTFYSLRWNVTLEIFRSLQMEFRKAKHSKERQQSRSIVINTLNFDLIASDCSKCLWQVSVEHMQLECSNTCSWNVWTHAVGMFEHMHAVGMFEHMQLDCSDTCSWNVWKMVFQNISSWISLLRNQTAKIQDIDMWFVSIPPENIRKLEVYEWF